MVIVSPFTILQIKWEKRYFCSVKSGTWKNIYFFQTSLIRNIIRFYRLMKLNKAKYNINRETHTNFYVLKNGITQEWSIHLNLSLGISANFKEGREVFRAREGRSAREERETTVTHAKKTGFLNLEQLNTYISSQDCIGKLANRSCGLNGRLRLVGRNVCWRKRN